MLTEQLEHERTGFDKDEFVVVFSDNRSFLFAREIVKKNEFFGNPDGFACRVWEIKLNIDGELSPASFLNSERRLADCNVGLGKRLVQVKFDFRHEL